MKNNCKTQSTNYPVGDFLTRVKNASMTGASSVQMCQTKMVLAVAKCLESLGFINDLTTKDGIINLSIVKKNKKSVLTNITLVSKPGLRVYINTDEIGKRKKPSTLIISTPKGILSDKKALKEKVGGEVIAEVL